MKLTVLASGSSANAAVLEAGSGYRILIDAGLSGAQLKYRLSLAGIETKTISAVFITHEHKDHCAGLFQFAKKHQPPIYASALTVQAMSKRPDWMNWKVFHSIDRPGFQCGSIYVQAFRVEHDAADPVGYIFTDGETSLGYATDLGSISERSLLGLEDCTTLFIEANYDEDMLNADKTRPWTVKERIRNPHGHLSNAKAAEIAYGLPNLRGVILGHLSRETNTPLLAYGSVWSRRGQNIESIEVAYRTEEERCDKPQEITIL